MTVVLAHTPTGTQRGVLLNRETILNRIHLEIISDPARSGTKAYAQVNLTDEEASKLHAALGTLLGLASWPTAFAEGDLVSVSDPDDGDFQRAGTVLGYSEPGVVVQLGRYETTTFDEASLQVVNLDEESENQDGAQ